MQIKRDSKLPRATKILKHELAISATGCGIFDVKLRRCSPKYLDNWLNQKKQLNWPNVLKKRYPQTNNMNTYRLSQTGAIGKQPNQFRKAFWFSFLRSVKFPRMSKAMLLLLLRVFSTRPTFQFLDDVSRQTIFISAAIIKTVRSCEHEWMVFMYTCPTARPPELAFVVCTIYLLFDYANWWSIWCGVHESLLGLGSNASVLSRC